MSAPLSNHQKGVIAQVARAAFDHQIARGALGDAAVFEDWRHEQQELACGRQSLRSATQDDYGRLMAKFLDLAGRSDQAYRYLVRAETNPLRVALAKLAEACVEAGVEYPEYPGKICRTMFKCGLDVASPKQVWKLVFTVRNRRDSVHRRAEAA